MKRYLISFVAVLMVLMAGAVRPPRTVQGITYVPRANSGIELMSDDWGDFQVPDDMAAPDGEFTFDMINSWTGEGENQAALVIQWNDDKEQNALVFGFRWDGQATGSDMIRAVVSANPRLYGLIQYTNVSSPTDPLGGYTINGFGWDLDNDGDISLWDEKDGQVYEAEDGLFIHPRGYDPEKGGSSDYDYDDWHATDTDDYWGAGWYLNYWSYWVKDNYEDMFSYSSWGASGRLLQNGSWDGWNYSVDMIPRDWKEFVAAPAVIPDGAKTEFEYNGLCYSLTDYSKKSVKLVAATDGVQPYAGAITVPQTFVDEGITYTVTEVAASAFAGTSITSITLPSTVTKIGAMAFDGCNLLTTFVLPEAMKTVPAAAYRGTALTEVLLPETVETINASAFENCVSLTKVEIPAKVKSIGEKAFYGCTALSDITYNTTSPIAISDNVFSAETYASATLTVPYGYESVFGSTSGWSGFTKFETTVIPVNDGDIFAIEGVTYKVISSADKTVAVTYCKVDGTADNTTITTANTAGYVGDIVIPSKVSYMRNEFSVITMEAKAFYGAKNMTSIKIEALIDAIPEYAFYNCTAMTSATLPSSLKSIGTYAFSYAKVASLTLPDGIETIGDRAFFQCTAMASINVPGKVTAIPNNCFSYCTSLKEIVFGDQITSIGSTVFQNCTSLTSVKLPAGLTVIPASMFNKCTALETLDIPAGVTEIKSAAFSGCSKLVVKLPAGLTTIGTEAFKDCIQITEFTFPESVTSIPNSVLYGCTKLTKVTMSKDVTAIGSSSFRNCASLTEFNFGEKLTSIGSYAFAGCTGFTELTLPECLTKLDTYSFDGCTSLAKINLPSNLTTLGNYSFRNTAITSVVIPEGIKTLNIYTFDGCKSLTSVSLPESLTTINGYVFRNTGLTQIVLPSMATLNGGDTFGNCTNITVYATGVTPTSCYSNGLRITTSVFAPLVVPTGTSEAYSAKASWNKASSITEPTMMGVSISDVKAEYIIGAATVMISGRFAVNYDLENLPEKFLEVNNAIVLDGFAPTMEINGQNVDVVMDLASSTFSCTYPLADIPEQVALKIAKDETAYTSELADVTSPGTRITKINDTQVNVVVTMEAKSLSELVDYEPKDATLTGMDLYIFDEETLEAGDKVELDTDAEFLPGYQVSEGKIQLLRGASSRMFEVRSQIDPSLKGLLYFSVNQYPVIGVMLDGISNSEPISLTANEILALKPTVFPDNAQNSGVSLKIENVTVEDMVNTYSVGGAEKFTELVTYKPGEFDIVLTSVENTNITNRYHVVVNAPSDEIPVDSYEDGTFWLNEDWFTHKNGSVNYLTDPHPESDDQIIYRAYGARNNGLGFGATSQYAMTFADKLFVMSKQENDKGDIRGVAGGRVVVADAHTLQRLASFDNIGGDGRACVGVSSEKVYLGTNAGIRVLRFDSQNHFTLDSADIAGINNDVESGSEDISDNQALYNKQIGDMVCSGPYVFAIQQGVGVHVIDVLTDKLLKTIDDSGVQGIVLDADGHVWYASLNGVEQEGCSNLIELDPRSAEEIRRVIVPGTISCPWGSWRSTNFFAALNMRTLFWTSSANSMMESGSTIYRWNIDEPESEIEPLYTIPAIEGVYSGTKRIPYASMRYDDRTGEILFATTTAPSGNYRWNWYNFLDVDSKELHTVALKPYYWFPALPVFPDKYLPEFYGLDYIDIVFDSGLDVDGFVKEIDLAEIVTDQDNHDSNIRISAEADEALTKACEVTLSGSILTFKALAAGEGSVTLSAESNGRISTINVPVTVSDVYDGLSEIEAGRHGKILVNERKAHLYNLDGMEFMIYSVDGRAVSAFRAEGDECHVVLTLPAGVYVLSSMDGSRSMKFILK